jgi:hypothetical protein
MFLTVCLFRCNQAAAAFTSLCLMQIWTGLKHADVLDVLPTSACNWWNSFTVQSILSINIGCAYALLAAFLKFRFGAIWKYTLGMSLMVRYLVRAIWGCPLQFVWTPLTLIWEVPTVCLFRWNQPAVEVNIDSMQIWTSLHATLEYPWRFGNFCT